MILLISLISFATAQESIDTHDLYIAPQDGTSRASLGLFSPSTHMHDKLSFEAVLEHDKDPLILVSEASDSIYSDPIVESITALNFAAYYAPTTHISLGVAGPVYFSSNSPSESSKRGIGDIRLNSVLSFNDHIAVVPFITVQTGYGNEYLGLSGVNAGGLLSASLSSDVVEFGVNVGAEYEPKIDFENLNGGGRLLAGGYLGVNLTQGLVAVADATYRPTTNITEPFGTDSPAEASIALRANRGKSPSFIFGGSSALNSGVGAPTWRLFGGINLSVATAKEQQEEVTQESFLEVITYDHYGQPVDATILVNELALYVGQDGYIITPIKPNEYHLVAYADGFVNESVDVIVSKGETEYVQIEFEAIKSVVIEQDKIVLLKPVYFDFDKDTVKEESLPILKEVASILTNHLEISVVEIQGHTDSIGSDEYNIDLSQRRMETVRDILVSHGINSSRLIAVGYGEFRPVADNESAEGRAENRRVEFTILERTE